MCPPAPWLPGSKHHAWLILQANNMVFHTAVEHFRRSREGGLPQHDDGLPHIITSNVEHDSVKLAAEHLQANGKAGGNQRERRAGRQWRTPHSASVSDVTFVGVSQESARVEVRDVMAAVRPNTCLVSVMLANNETGVVMVGDRVPVPTQRPGLRCNSRHLTYHMFGIQREPPQCL